MAEHNIQGKLGEDLAVSFLERQGYQILHRNWRSGHKELDIVALDRGTLVIAEVKTRRNLDFGNPADAINDQKIRRIVSSADAYIRKFRLDYPVRFDIISVVTDASEPQIEHIQEAFFPPIW